MSTRTQRRDGAVRDRLRNGLRERTLLGGVGVALVVAGGSALGGRPAIIVGVVASLLWLLGSTPAAIAVGTIGITGFTEPATVSTVFAGTQTTFPSPVVGVGLLGAGVAGLAFEPVVTARRPTRALGIGSLLVVAVFASVLAIAHLEALSIYATTAVSSGLVLFLSGVLSRTVTVRTAGEEGES
ncbi:hypothetical protein [Haloplanus halobius]|uniref:hypothetical protein n=1 Tax=Haloplanus halobius TaxID=2934938 RepID=UPI00200F2778|nr:hypothetical protein [Haloplanus sp. XH21]